MAWDGVLVRFGEIGIKSPPVRRRMLDRLRQNLLDQLLCHGVEGDVRQVDSRLWMEGPDKDALLRVASLTFGVVSASLVRTCNPTMHEMGAAAAELAMQRPWTRFAVRAHRAAELGFTSQDMGRDIGSAVWTAAEADGRTPRVDLTSPEFEIHVEARAGAAYLYTESAAGPGGLPMGTQGKVVALLSDPASFVAAWLMMRRGCRVVPVHAGQAQSLPTENLETLQRWGLGTEVDLLPMCTGFVSKRVLLSAAQVLAARTHCDAVVTGERLDSTLVVPEPTVPVLRPVCGLAPAITAGMMERIGLADDEPEHILDADARETVETALSMHRVIEV